MKKIKLILPIVTTSLATALGTTIALTSCNSNTTTTKTQDSSTEISQEVTEQGVSVASYKITQGKQSHIVLKIPSGKYIYDIVLKVGDSILSKNELNITNNKVTIPADKMPGNVVIICDINLKDWPGPEPTPTEPVNFFTCDWSEIDLWCQMLEMNQIDADTFCAHFTNGKTAFTSIDEMLGLERVIRINDLDHIVRVIATQHDTISEDGELKDKKAALTFELKTLLSNSNGDSIKSKWNEDKTNYDYTQSTIRANLGGDSMATKTWDKTALEMLEDETTGCPDLACVIKSTKHVVAITETKSWAIADITRPTYSDKLFLPSYKNLTTDKSQYCKDTKNTIYEFYSDKETEGEEQAANARIKTDVNEEAYHYWVASAFTQYTNTGWIVKQDGFTSSCLVDTDSTVGVSFCFSI